ncbi:protein transporter [Ephemerocybe angulata]|uniref:Protein transporter n=1 Tax=Ephemerocybe angulata TaxID=980116 RepID=A0A8H6I9X7_9AGAR|nr:protein transporter [Tulosesus angulatus]
MDGFDDLLAPSRAALESNPFADDFNGSTSSDPWASPFGAASSDDPFGSTSGFIDQTPYTSPPNPYDDSTPTPQEPEPEAEDVKAPVEHEPTGPSDPLDSANVTAQDDEEDNRPLGILRTPGFRESVASSPPAVETKAPQPLHGIASPLPSLSVPQSPAIKEGTPRARTPTVASPSEIQAQQTAAILGSSSKVVQPQEGPSNVLENSLAGLSLGIEPSGWQSQTDDSGAWGRTELPTPTIPTPTPTANHADEDSDDDKPINQTLKRAGQDDTQSPLSPKFKPEKPDNGIQPVFVITVDDPQKVGDPIRPFTMYTVHTRTTSPLFQKSAFSVLRRYSDFVWLYETLCFNNPGVVVPPVPEKNTFGRFEDQFLRQRRLALEKCIQKIANHPNLGKDDDLRLFLESDTFSLDIKHRKPAPIQEKGGLIASIGASLTGPRFNETDEWFDRQKAYLDSLESQLRGLVRSIETVAKHRQELSLTIGEFAQAVGDLSASDVGKQLSVALGELAEVERKAQDLQSTQSEEDCSTLMATVDEYARLINSVRAAFSSRIRVYYAWKTAENDLLRTKQNHERNRISGRVLEAKHEYDHVCKLVKVEVARFEQERIEDFKDSLHAFLEGMISRQKELISTWENYQQLLLKRAGGGGAAAAVV